jgi:hypothetical protein
MKNIVLTWLLLLAVSVSYAQSVNPVHWKCWSKRLSSDTYELHFTAAIDNPYHIYAQLNNTEIALPTKINFYSNSFIKIQGKVNESGNLENLQESDSGEMINYYADKVDFMQVIILKSKIKTKVKGYIDYMACTNEHCLPQAKQIFSITVQQ